MIDDWQVMDLRNMFDIVCGLSTINPASISAGGWGAFFVENSNQLLG